jgi:membrane-bound lytic murein transglycosylase B
MNKQTQRELVADLVSVGDCAKTAANYLKASGMGVASLHSIATELLRLGAKIEKLIERAVKEEELNPPVEKKDVKKTVAKSNEEPALLYNELKPRSSVVH